MDIKLEKIGRDFQESLKKLLREYAEALFLAILLALVLRHFAFASYRVTSASMMPSLRPGDYVVGFKVPYGMKWPWSQARLGKPKIKRDEISIIQCDPVQPELNCVKRVLGLPGDMLELKKGTLYRNGEIVKVLGLPQEVELTQVVPPQQYFVSSDKFGHSQNHFEWGLVAENRFEARAILIWFSTGPEGVDWRRIGQIIR